jgi:hypothetical protein
VAAEAVWSREFRRAFDALDEGKGIEVDFAIYAIEEDPAWDGEGRKLAPADSPYSGKIADLTVDGYVIIYQVADKGAAVELWYLYELPGTARPATRRKPPTKPDDAPMM